MRPMTFVNGVLLGSAGALASVLGVILLFRWTMVGDASLDQTVVQGELPFGTLVQYMCIFTALALVALAAFWGELRSTRWRLAADWFLLLALVAAVLYFFANPALRLRDFAVLALLGAAGVAIYGIFSRLGWTARLAHWLGD
ncbi:MAG TPA: hypothetical protein VGM16_08965 [Gammaproteobacteria bacterium]